MGKPRTAAVGIDLGTTNSVVAVVEAGKPHIILNSERERITPSTVALLDGGEVLVGLQAKRQSVLNPLRTISSAKRFIGSRYQDLAAEDLQMPYKVIADRSGAVRLDLGNGELASPEEIGAMIIRRLVKDASDYLGAPVTEAVITVPAYFNDAQRQATKHAGTIAGIEVLRIINEPTAAALAYGLEKRRCEKILVFDLGGGTFDVSILDVQENLCEVCATSGDTHLGGDVFDRALLDWVADQFKAQHGVDLRDDPQTRARLSEAVERAKCDLSLAQQTVIDLPFIAADSSGSKHLTQTLTREKFDEITDPLVKRCTSAVTEALEAARLEPKDIDEVLLVGGSTRIPAIRKLVKELMNGLEPSMSVSPDEVVALGAAVQAAIIKGDLDDLVLLDVTPFSLGLYTEGGKMEKMIERNTAIPTRETKLFSTSENFQRGVDIVILQGESENAKANAELGRFALDGITTHLKGEAQIEICFDIDENGILHVTAKDLLTELQQKLVITGTTNLKHEEVLGMAKNATDNAARDTEQLRELEAKQQAQYAIHRAEELLRGLAADIPRDVEAIKANCEALLNGVREAVEKNASERKLRKLKSSLDQAIEQLAQHH